jgi:predicted GNAT family acetyltransferase
VTSDNLQLLDNPAWHAMSTLQRSLAEVNDAAGCYLHSVSPFAGLADPNGDLDALHPLAGDRPMVLVMSRPDNVTAVTAGWQQLAVLPCHQMVCTEPQLSDVSIGQKMIDEDAPAMLALAELTEPGPFAIETNKLGNYFGVYDQENLAAMAGERFRLPGFVEVSGVCTHPSARGKGYASQVVSRVLAEIKSRDEIAFLHVRKGSPSEHSAIRVYEKLGFVHHQEMVVQVLRPK